MDLVAWSPAICRELKRLCTRVPKKRAPKPAAAVPQFVPAPIPQAFPQFQQQYPMMQAFQPTPIAPQYVQQYPGQVPDPQSSNQTLENPAFNPGTNTQQQYPNPGPASQPLIQVPGNSSPSHNPGASSAQCFNVDVGPMTEDKHTKFLSTLVGFEKAFRVPATVKKPDGIEVKIERSQSQTDQGSDMNVISQGMVTYLNLPLQRLSDIGFKGLSMRTADHRETVLQYWVWLIIAVEGIWRKIRCFVAPEVVSVTETGRSE